MNEFEVAEQQAVKERLLEQSKTTGTCKEWRVFKLGANGTAMVSCGLPPDHNDERKVEDDLYCVSHVARQQFDDGSSVVFRWV